MQLVTTAQEQPVAVSVSLSWHTFVAITMAVVIGLALYDLARIAYDWADETARQVWPLVRWWWRSRDPWWPRVWSRIVGDRDDDHPGPVYGWTPGPTPPQDNREQQWGWWVTAARGGTLHRHDCQVLALMKHTRRPFVWANNLEEARHYSQVQGLAPCIRCRPLEEGEQEVADSGDQR